MGVATAIVGASVIAAGASIYASESGKRSAAKGASRAADASILGTQMQVDELARQFDYQMELLQPLLQNQYAANDQFARMMGYGSAAEATRVPRTPNAPGGGNARGRPAAPPGQGAGAAPSAARPGQGMTYGGAGAGVPGGGGFGSSTSGLAAQGAPSNQFGQSSQGLAAQGVPTGPVSLPGNTFANRPDAGGFDPNQNRVGQPQVPGVDPWVPPEAQPAPPGRGTGVPPDPYAPGQPGGFRDPNLNQRQFGGATAQDTEYGQHAFGNTLATMDPDQDLAIQRARETALYQGIDADSLVQEVRGNQLRTDVGGRQLAAGSLAEDERFRFAQSTGVVGDTFEESPGFRFQMEEAMRAVDRSNSRGGGNMGARAMLESQRRATGLAQSDYYNYVGARQADLGRQDQAAAAYQGQQAFDASRLDSAAMSDIARQDAAVRDARRREEQDIARGDLAMASYFDRRAGDLGRQDAAILNNQQLQQYDQARQDQGYYNYMAQLAGAAGIGQNYVGQAVGASGGYGANVGNAYANQGNALANIYQQQGYANAQQNAQLAGNLNSAVQGGLQNYFFAQGLGG